MPALRPLAIIVLGLLLGLNARADEPGRSLDAVDTGQSESLDAADTGESGSLDAADTGGSGSLDSADTGKAGEVDPADTEGSSSLDAVDTGRSSSLDKAETAPPAPPSAPPALPEIADARARAQARAARDAAVAAEQRLVRANAAYSEMMTRGHPLGDARVAIVQEREAAQRAYAEASSSYAALLRQLP